MLWLEAQRLHQLLSEAKLQASGGPPAAVRRPLPLYCRRSWEPPLTTMPERWNPEPEQRAIKACRRAGEPQLERAAGAGGRPGAGRGDQ